MKRILVTGGTVFVSKYTASYFQSKGYDVYVLNRGTKAQAENVTLIQGDRHNLGDSLRAYDFDWIIDVCAYDKEDVRDLLDGLGNVKNYIMISSSAVYPQTNSQPFSEDQEIGPNSVWGAYGINKIEGEVYLRRRFPKAYILRPPYLYGPMQNVYREPFVFDCAMENRPFYIPDGTTHPKGSMKLQFFHVADLCRFIHIIMEKQPKERVFNVGNSAIVDINAFVQLCYDAVGVPLERVYVGNHGNQRDYFPFYDYEYILDVSRQNLLMPQQKDLFHGLKESFQYYQTNNKDIVRKGYIEFIRQHLM